jgi:hypothetical protein
MARGGAWLRTGRVNGSDAAARRIIVHVCNGCGLWHEGKKPAQCLSCGRMDFTRFDSKGEAKYFATLQMLERAGEISDLRRQVVLPLMTVGREGLPVQWSKMIVDYAYSDDTGAHFLDFKPAAGMSPDSALKIRCLEAQGIIVEIVTSKGRD